MAPLAGDAPFSVETRKALTAAAPFSVETRKALTAARPFSVQTRLALSAPRPFSVRTDTILEGARPFSVETRRAITADAPFSVRTGESVPAEAIAAGLDYRVQLQLPDGSLVPVASWSLTEAISHGWDWSAELPYWAANAFSYDEEDHFRFVGRDGLGNNLRTPPLIAKPRTLGSGPDGETTTFSGVDEASYWLSKDGFSYDTFRNSTTSIIMAQLASDANVGIIGMPSIGLIEEDIKQAKAADVLTRYLDLAAYDYIVRTNGQVYCIPFQSTGESYRVKPSSIVRESNPLDRIKSFHFSKTSSIQDRQTFRWDSVGYKIEQLINPLNSVSVQNVSTLGTIDQIGIWSGDPTQGGKLIQFYNLAGDFDFLSVPINGTYPATHISCYVYASQLNPAVAAALYVHGTVPGAIPAGVSLAFEQAWSSGGQGVDGGVISEQGMPSAAWVLSRAQLYAWMRGRGLDVLRLEGTLDFSFGLADEIDAVTVAIPGSPRTWPSARVESINHSGSAGQVPSTNLIAMVIPW